MDDKQPILYLNKKDSYLYLYSDAAKQIGRDASVQYRFLDEKNDIIFRPIKNIDTLYHYCNVNTMTNIIRNRCLWLTNCLWTNDAKELYWSIDKYEELINNALTNDEIYPNISNKEELLSYVNSLPEYYKNAFLQNIQQNEENINKLLENGISIDFLRNELINLLIEVLGELRKNISPTYISSFSIEKDNLSLWRGYGDNGNGIAIGFDANRLINQDVFLEEIYYHDNIQRNILKAAVGYYAFDRNKEKIKHWIYEILPTLKHIGFKEEHEWRLIFLPKENACLKEITYTKDGYLRNRYELPLEDDFITEIILGPKCDKKNEEIIEFINSNGFNITEKQIKKSKIPYL